MIDTARPLRILIVEDDKASAKMLEMMLRKTSSVHSELYCSDCLSKALMVLREQEMDLVLLDLNLPDSSGLDTLAEVHRLDGNASIIVITGEYDDCFGRQVVMNGAQDFLTKGMFSAYTLSKSISHAVERNMIMHRLRETEGMYRMIFQNSAVAITFVDEKERLVSWNEFTETLLGMDKEDLHMRPISSLYPQQEWEKMRARNIRARGMQHHLETKMVKKDGQTLDIDISLSVLRNDEGDPISSIGVFTDITQRKEIENELNQTLVRAHDTAVRADEANAAKSEFLANMSHEIRTPLNAIVNLSELLAEEDLSDQQKRDVDIINESAESLRNLINDILDFSKIEAGELHVEMIECSLARQLNSLEAMMKTLAEKKLLDFRIVMSKGLPALIRSDPTRLRQCLVNLVSNAIKFTEQGQVRVNVSLEDRNNTPYIRFDVTDTGIGIPQDKQGQIFESFAQADGSTTRKYGGTGLGLAVTKRLAELLGGELTVTSELGRGSTFSLSIPAGLQVTEQALLDRHNTTERVKPANGESRQVKFSGCCLVADDVSANQVVMKRLLKRAGVEVVTANDGREALEHARNQSFDLIFMDMQMPRMDGFQATRRIRSGESGDSGMKSETRRVPIVALTASAMKGDDSRCFEAGCSDYMTKPIDSKRLHEILAKYLSTAKQEDFGLGVSDCETGEEVQAGNSENRSADFGSRQETPPSLPKSEIPINWPDLCQRVDDDESTVRAVVEAWLVDNPNSMVALVEAVKTQNVEGVTRLAHTMKGSASVISANALAQAALPLELAGRKGELANADTLLADIQMEFDKLKAFLSQCDWIDRAKTGS